MEMPSKTRKTKYSSSENLEMVKKYKLWMLKAKSDEEVAGLPTADELNYQENLFQILEKKSLNPIWITSDECLKRKYREEDFYVLPVFRGAVFNYLVSLKCRVYGSLALIMCLARNERLPKRHTPIWSTTLQGAIVCFSGIEIDTRKRQLSLVKMLGGTISKAFTEKVTHLVADSQDTESKKFVAAIDYFVPVMSVNWVYAAWKAAKMFSESKYIDESFINEHKLGIFSKCVISCSGIAPQDRPTLSQLIETNGGIYSGNMRKGQCTHLVTDLNSGEKYRVARKWGWDRIKIVRMRWVTKSVEKGHRLPERLYETKMNSTLECSTPRSSQLSNFRPPPDLEISPISRLTSQQQAIGTTNNSELQSKITLRPQQTKSETLTSEVLESALCESNLVKMKLPQRATVADDPIVTFDLESIRFNEFMRDCIIYLCGISDENFKKYKWLTNKVGSRRRDRLVYTDTTHIVVGPHKLDWRLIEQLKEKARNKVKVVTCEWLMDCAKAQKIVDENDYLIFERDESEYECSQRTCDNIVGCDNGSSESKMKPKLKITQLGNELLGKAVGISSRATKSCSFKRDVHDRSSSIGSEDSGDSHLFSGLSFRIIIKDNEIQEQLSSDIEKRGGRVKTEVTLWVNYAICLVLDCHLIDELANFNCGDIISTFWLKDCIEKGAVLNAERHPLYRPVEAITNPLLFKNCVIALSGLPASEKDIYIDTLKRYGAEVRNHLSRNEQDKQLSFNTYFITGAEADCTECARRWQIPVVDPSWILESVIQNELQPIDPYLFRDQPYKNYTRKDRLWMIASGRKSIDDAPNLPDGELNFVGEQSSKRCGNEDSEQVVRDSCGIVEQSLNLSAKKITALKDRNSLAEFHRSQELVAGQLMAGLDLREAYAYVDQMKTQNMTGTSGVHENLTDTAVEHLLHEAVIKTAHPSNVPWSASVKEGEFNRMQTRQSKRKVEFTPLTAAEEISKKARIENAGKCSEVDVLKEAKKRKIADKLADLALRRAEFARVVEAEKAKQREQEKKMEKVNETLKKPTRKKVYESPQREYVGWEESNPRPIATQIINPFDSYVDEECETSAAEIHAQEEHNQRNEVSTSKADAVACISNEAPTTFPKKICFTSTASYDRNSLAKMAQDLGGEVCNEFDDTVTHLVCGNIVRNEKLLCSIAKGVTIVDVDYIIDSHAQSNWLKTDDYEWGSDKSLTKHSSMEQRFVPLARACRLWRIKIEKNPVQRAFQGWKALFYCSRSRFADLKGIIGFGGGEAHLRDDVSSLEGFNIALAERSKYWNAEEVAQLIKNKIQCFHVDYLATYLTLEEGCDLQRHFHKDYAAALSRITRS